MSDGFRDRAPAQKNIAPSGQTKIWEFCMTHYVSDEAVYQALRLDLSGGFPADTDFVDSLILAAQSRLEKWIGRSLSEFDELPPELGQAILVDVSNAYFNRLDPTLPPAYFDLILPHRAWGFGGGTAE